MTKIKGSTVLITGGASGIGRLMGDMCMQQLAKLLPVTKGHSAGPLVRFCRRKNVRCI